MTQNKARQTAIASLSSALLIIQTGCAGNTTKPKPAAAGAEVSQNPIMKTRARAIVASVHSRHGFAVLDFGSQSLPEAGTELEVMRAGQKVGRVRVTDPMHGRHTTADVLEGDLQAGDQVR